ADRSLFLPRARHFLLSVRTLQQRKRERERERERNTRDPLFHARSDVPETAAEGVVHALRTGQATCQMRTVYRVLFFFLGELVTPAADVNRPSKIITIPPRFDLGQGDEATKRHNKQKTLITEARECPQRGRQGCHTEAGPLPHYTHTRTRTHAHTQKTGISAATARCELAQETGVRRSPSPAAQSSRERLPTS
ncbi:MAG: hypothetical protein BJ554DRAFT_3403, partial [Olpidium bornovanus]